jgi:hypothetical protein
MAERPFPTGAIPLIQVDSRRQEPYLAFVGASLALAVLAGFALGIHVPLSRLLGIPGNRAPEMVQIHGQVQLLGFAGLFVIGMSLRLMPRFSHSRLQLEGLLPLIWALLVGSLLARAFVLVWLPGGWHDGVSLALQLALLLAAAAYLLVATATLTLDRNGLEATGWFFLVGAWFFFLQALAGLYVDYRDIQDGQRLNPYLANTAVLYLQLGGFLMAFVGGVATRAVPTMLGLPRPERAAKAAALALAVSVSAIAGGLLLLQYASPAGLLERLVDLGFAGLGLSFLTIAWLSGAMQSLTNRLRPASEPHLRLVRLAFVWLTLGGLLTLWFGLEGLVRGELPAVQRLDALRHMTALGTITTLIVGMGLMILPEFAQQRMRPNRQRLLSTVLLAGLFTATTLRVLPGLVLPQLDPDLRDAAFASAGLIAELSFLAFAFTLFQARRAPHSLIAI